MPSVVEVLAETLDKAGTPFMVGIPGEETLDVIEAARQRGMRFILMKQEAAGAMLAATWGEITGSPGICLATRGPGAANMTLGVAHAFTDRCPLIAVTDRFPAATHEVGLRQRIDQRALYAPITKWGGTLEPTAVRRQLLRAVRVATAGPPGPVHFDLPADVRNADAGAYFADVPLAAARAAVVPDKSGLAEPLAMLREARRPVLLVGLGVFWSHACSELVALAERLGAPVLTTTKCKGAIPEDHPLSAGCLFAGLMERRLVSEADLIVTVGLDPIELSPSPWPYTASVLALSGVESLDAIVPVSLLVVGALEHILHALAQWAREGTNWGERAARAYRENVAALLDTPSNGLSPQAAMTVARSVMPRETIATCDAGASRLFSAPLWSSYGEREFLASNGLGSMGYAVPAAMAARLAHPARPIVAFTGDGGFLMAVAELQTCVRENLPITIVVLDDGELGVMRVRQDMNKVPRYGTGIGGVDWEKLAQSFGADGHVVETENALGDALGTAAKSSGTTLIAARIDASGYVEQFKAMRRSA